MQGEEPRSEAAGREPVERLAEAFFERYRRGERPSITEYVENHPELAGEIRELLPALLLMEQAGGGTAAGEEVPGKAGMPMPQRLGEYRLLREIGRGGMGVVYEAEQESLGRRVVLKVLPFHSLFDGRRIERFRRESRAAASLHHPNIVPIHAVGEIDGIHYYTMQFIDGQSLDAVIAEVKRLREAASSGSGGVSDAESGASTATLLRDGSGRIAINDSHLHYHRSAARICLQAAEALASAHGEGIHHRDIKPSNLLLDAQGKVWVADFGLAKAEGTAELTLSGDLIGTLRYMAPERLQGWSDHRSDIYSLGLTLYEILTLQPAFKDSDRTRLIRQVAEVEPTPPSRLDRRIPLDLETIVIKAIAKEPGRRYPSAADLADDLRRFLANEPIRARSVTRVERAWRWCRRKPAIATLAGAVSVLLLVIAAGASIAALELREKLRDSRLGEARMSRLTRRDGQRFRSLEAIRGAAGIRPGPDLRDEAIACLSLVDIGEALRCWAPPADSVIVPFNFDADLERYVCSEERAAVSIRATRSGRELLAIPGLGDKTEHLLFSPDGRSLVVGTMAENRRYEVGSWRPAAALPREGARDLAGESDFTADGALLAVSASRTLIQLVDPATFQCLARLESPDSRVISKFRFSPGSDLLAAATPLGIQVWDLRRIRDQLRVLGLDWDPSLPPSGRAAAAGKPLRVAVDLGELTPLLDEKTKARAGMVRTIADSVAAIARDPGDAGAYHRRAHAYQGLGLDGGAAADFRAAIEIYSRRLEAFEVAPAGHYLARAACRWCFEDHAGAIGDYRKALEIDPRSARALEGLAWALLAAPPGLRDLEAALPLAIAAVETADRKQKPLNTLGAAYYRLGRYREAVETLDLACRAHERDGTSLDFLFLAMCHQRLGDPDQARYFFDRAERGFEESAELSSAEHRVLDSLRAEAKALLDPEEER